MLIAKIKENLQFDWQHPSIAFDELMKHGNEFVMVSIKKVARKRNLEQNSKIHAMLSDISNQVEYAGRMWNVEDWKDILTAGYKIAAHNLEIAPCPDSDKVVILGLHTSKMTVSEMSDFITYLYSFGNERDVVWSEPQ